MGSLNGLAFSLVLTGAFFYVLYFVVRAAVRDGVRQALPPGGVTAQTIDQPEA